MNIRRLTFLVICLLAAAASAAQSQSAREISKKERELQKLRDEIRSFERKLTESEKRERTVLDRLDNMEEQVGLIRTLIKELVAEEKKLTGEVRSAKSSISDLEEQLSFLRSHYAGYVTSVYKNGRVYDLELLFSSKSVNQLSIRIEYLKRFSSQRAEDLKRILEKKDLLERQNEELQSALERERQLLSEKTREERSLRSKVSERKRMLSRIRTDQRTYTQELSRRTKAAQEIEQIIADLIEKERIRKEREAEARRKETASTATPPRPATVTATALEQKRGKLRWPVSSGSLASRYGMQVHPVLRTVTQNAGIDISVKLGSDVVAVADGEVSILKFIPGFGNVLILDHSGGYRTVYAHLAEIDVIQSQIVREGDRIGRSGDSIVGDVLHFELWKDRQSLNPELWLAKRR
jgi:septal ring factor EnvC (AmiA/AmiB activator)